METEEEEKENICENCKFYMFVTYEDKGMCEMSGRYILHPSTNSCDDYEKEI